MDDLIITVFDNKPEKLDHFINSVEYRGMRVSDLLDFVSICRRTGKNIRVSFIGNNEEK